jgi:succinate dehydrogenase / fumarate reductase, cytochrome b subunit
MSDKRPMSPFMIGPYYRPQITSMMSIAHRATGVVLAIGSLLLVWFLLSLAMGPESFAVTQACLSSLLGQIVLFAFSLCLMYHFFNGLRHLFWDAGKGFEIATVYRSGYAVLALTVLATAALWWFARMSGGAA